MVEPAERGLAVAAERHIGQIVGLVARLLALAGGLVLVALVLMSVVSIAGRSLVAVGLRPIPGDFELVEIGCAFAVFAFLPWCQYRGGHVTVDLVTDRLGSRAQALLAMIGNFLMTIISVVLTWRLFLGTLEKIDYQETTYILLIPVWWGYVLALIGASVFVLVSAYTVWRSLNEALGASAPHAMPSRVEAGP